MASNPFFVGGPVRPEYFVGRELEVNIAFDQIAKRAHAAFYGSPGMGKSSLLRYLASPQVWESRGKDFSEAIAIYLNCTTSVLPFTPDRFWREVLMQLREEVQEDEVLVEEIDTIFTEDIVEMSDVRSLLRQLGRRDKFLLLLLDDYDGALSPNEKYTEAEMLIFLSEFRDLAVHRREGEFLSTIVTTFRRLTELGPTLPPSGSPWYNHYLFQPLKPFSEAEVEARFFSSNSPLWIPVSSKLQDGVRSISDGHPALLQNAGYLLYAIQKNQQTPQIDRFTQDFISQTEQFFRDTWEFSTDIEQVLMMLVALSHLEGRLHDRQYAIGDLDLIFSQRNRELIDLEERGVLRQFRRDEKIIYEFASSVMEWWVVREIENSDEAELQRREKVFLKLMSRDRASQIQNTIRTLWQYRDTVQSIVTWIVAKFGGV
ncbi:AAA family ATPase [Baaleninema simplex]|uniref:AAA family ATPase n=1 Tax=Baaleninema simplex TaxID=2862350 RepID=UPI0003477A39|nr:AAA family ATPase [Baaleninema simplex]